MELEEPKLIVCDLDGCVYSFTEAMRRWCVEMTGRPASDFPDPDKWRFWTDWGMDEERFLNMMYSGIKAGVVFGTGQPIARWDKLAGLRHGPRNVHIQVVTHRGVDLATHAIARALTRSWLYTHGFDYDQLSVVRERAHKLDTVQIYAHRLGVQPENVYAMDDHHETVAAFVEAGYNVGHISDHWNLATLTVAQWQRQVRKAICVD